MGAGGSDLVAVAKGEGGKAQFFLGGSPFRFIGVNMRDLVYYGKTVGGTPLCPGTVATPDDRRMQLRMARAMGARVVRLFLPHNRLAIRAPDGSMVTDTDTIAGYLGELLALPEAQDLYFIVALTNVFGDTPNHPVGDDRYYTAPSGRFSLLNDEWFTSGFKRSGGYLDFVTRVIRPFVESPRIMAWEVGNELRAPGRDPLIPFMHHVAEEIRRLDQRHMVTTGLQGLNNAFPKQGDEGEHDYARAKGPELYGAKTRDGSRELYDFVTIHAYDDEEQATFLNRYATDVNVARVLNKPFVVEEAGFSRTDHAAPTRLSMGKWFGRGASGYMPWSWWAAERDHCDGSRSTGVKPGRGDWGELWMVLCEQANLLEPDPAKRRRCDALGSNPKVP